VNSTNTTCTIAAPLEQTFEVFSDFGMMAGRIKGIKRIEMLTPGPVQLGTKFRETRQMHGHDATEEMEITAFDRPRMYDVSCRSCGCCVTTTFRFETVNDGTQVTTEVVVQAGSWMAKLLFPLRNMLIRMIQKCVSEDVADLKRVLESRSPAAA